MESTGEIANNYTIARPQWPAPVTPLELFFDLIYVFAAAQLAHGLSEHLTWSGAAQLLADERVMTSDEDDLSGQIRCRHHTRLHASGAS
jgi:hypothetical protein